MRETARERRELAADAGFGPFSFMSVLAGVLVAYGAFAILAGVAASILGAAGDDTDLSGGWEQLGTTGGLVVAVLLFLSYLLGGYVAGRMARRNGLAHGAGVLVLGLLIVGVVAALVRSSGGVDTIAQNLRSLGIPTTADEYGDAGTIAGIASLIALVAGSLVGGLLGERWHARLFARAIDPNVGAQAAAAREVEEARTRANLTLARSEGRARAHELERDRDRDRVLAQEIEDEERARDIDPVAVVDRDGDREADLARDRAQNTDTDSDDTLVSGNGQRRITRRR
jgi:hypothetical protein